MTFADLTAEVFRRLEESAQAPVFWTEADVRMAINEGYMEISDASEWHEASLTLDLLSHRTLYDLRTVTADPILSVRAAMNAQTGRWLLPSVVSDLDRGDRRWGRVMGEPQRFFLRSLWWLGLYPQPAANAGTVRLRITTLPTVLEADGDEPGFARTLHYGLVEFALADLWAQDAETTKALAAWTEYLRYESALSGLTDGRLGTPLVHMAGAH
jgi:hypothetical protein